MNIIVYGISLRTGGGYSVLSDFYEEVSKNADKYPDIKWIFVLSKQKFASKENIEVINFEWSIKSFFHRAYLNYFTIKKLIKEYDAKAILSLQNMMVAGSHIPNIVCLHNVLPFYKCDKNVLDSFIMRVKQQLVNYGIGTSIKKCYKVFVASEWIKETLKEKYGINEEKVVISKLHIPKDLSTTLKQTGKRNTFFYPAASYPYKNHKVILNACEILKNDHVEDYEIKFTFDKEQSKTAAKLYDEVKAKELNVRFTGSLSRDEILHSYSTSVLLFPSKIENDAMPLIECMQFGGYTLAADLPYARDVLEFYSAKEYFEADDAITLANQMKNIIMNGIPEVPSYSNNQMSNESRVEKIVKVLREL